MLMAKFLFVKLVTCSSKTRKAFSASYFVFMPGDHYSLESMHTLAEDAWKEQLVAMKGKTKNY